jgi:hypothetical protein
LWKEVVSDSSAALPVACEETKAVDLHAAVRCSVALLISVVDSVEETLNVELQISVGDYG